MSRAERTRQILSIAEELFAERGYLAATMDELAQRVGVSKPVIYDCVGPKERILLAVLGRIRAELREATLRAVAGVTDPREALRETLLAFFRFIEGHRQGWSVLNRERALLAGQAGEEVDTLRRQQADLITELLLSHGLAAGREVAECHAQIVVGAAERLALWQDGRPQVTAEVAADRMMEALWQGLAPAAPDRAPR